jgi:ribosomal protein L24
VFIKDSLFNEGDKVTVTRGGYKGDKGTVKKLAGRFAIVENQDGKEKVIDVSNLTKDVLDSISNLVNASVESAKQKLKNSTMKENFGQDIVRKLKDKFDYDSIKYGTSEERTAATLIDRFDEWCMNYTGRDSTDENDFLTLDPLTGKGKEIMAALKEQYGEKEGEGIFYAMKNKGELSGVDKKNWKDRMMTKLGRRK